MTAFLACLLACTAPAKPAARDLTPLFPDEAWLVYGIEAKRMHESELGQALFGKQSLPDSARKLVAAMKGDDLVGYLNALAPLNSQLENVTRVHIVIGVDGHIQRSDHALVLIEGEFDEAKVAAGIEAVCKNLKEPYKLEKFGDRTVYAAGPEDSVRRTVRLDERTLAVAYTAAGMTALLDRHAGRQTSKAAKAVVDGVKSIDAAATPLWIVAGENKVGDKIDYTRMVATITLGTDSTLNIRMETPDAEAAKRCRDMLELYAALFALSKDAPLWKALGTSTRVEIGSTAVTATAKMTGKSLATEIAKVKE